MTCMERPYRVGDCVRIKHCPPFELPAELASGVEVVVVASEPGTTQVRDATGREWRISMCCVSAGMIYRLEGERHWRRADDARVVAELRRILAMERAHLATADASKRVVLETACAGLEARLART